MDSITVTALVQLIVLLGASSFFSGSETAIFSLTEVELAEMERSGRRRSSQAARLARNAHSTFVTVLLANMTVNVLITVVSTSLAIHLLGNAALVVAIPVTTIVLLLFGEIVPKSLGLRRGRPLAELAAPVLTVIAWMLGPVQTMLETLSLKVVGRRKARALDVDELSILLEIAHDDGQITGFEQKVLKRILHFADVPVSHCMTPRVEMIMVESDAPREKILKSFDRSGRSRLPVYENTPDHVVGLILLKDVLLDENETKKIASDWMREAIFEPETLKAGELFRRFQARHLHMAIIVGEHGGVEGLVTLEDLLEEIVGDIRDEADEPDRGLELMADGSWRVDASMALDDLAEAIDVEWDENEEAVTLSGLLQNELGRVPRAGDAMRWKGLRLRVLTASPNRPRLIRIRREEN